MRNPAHSVVSLLAGCLLLALPGAEAETARGSAATQKEPAGATEPPEPTPAAAAGNLATPGSLPGRGLPRAPALAAARPRPEAAQKRPQATSPEAATGESTERPIFRDGAAEAGLAFTHFNGSDGRHLFAEVMGSGAALFDYDGDGDLDAFLVQGAPFPPSPEGAGSDEGNAATKEEATKGATGSDAGSPATGEPPEPATDRPPDPAPESGSEPTPDPPPEPAGRESQAAGVGDPADAGSPPGGAGSEAAVPPAPAGDRLFRNLLVESGELAFEDVTAAAGIRGVGHGMGVAVGDVDGDGDPDLYVTALGSNRLWLNQGDGTFRDATVEARADDPRWSTAASFFDADLDGDLDLWVANYVDWSVERDQTCRSPAGHRDYCGPLTYPSVADRLLENLGGGRFADASSRTRIRLTSGAALGSLAVDLEADPRPEVYVANDASANQLWAPPRADGVAGDTLTGRWTDVALEAGLALNGQGRPEGSMGIDAGDYDADGDLDLFLTHVHYESNTLYRNDGEGSFTDVTEVAGLAAPSLGMTGFGTAFLDYDNDGWLDLLVVNGTVNVIPELAAAGDPFPLAQPDQLFRNLGRGDTPPGRPGVAGATVRFTDVSTAAGPALTRPRVSRGAAFGDVDNDGDTDVLINDSGAPARLLLNQLGQNSHWLGLHLRHPAGQRLLESPGAHVTLELPSGRRLLRRVRLDGSYLAAHDPRLLFGLADGTSALAAHVHWPDGTQETFDLQSHPIDRYHTLTQGQSQAP